MAEARTTPLGSGRGIGARPFLGVGRGKVWNLVWLSRTGSKPSGIFAISGLAWIPAGGLQAESSSEPKQPRRKPNDRGGEGSLMKKNGADAPREAERAGLLSRSSLPRLHPERFN